VPTLNTRERANYFRHLGVQVMRPYERNALQSLDLGTPQTISYIVTKVAKKRSERAGTE
jgi:hypothetical protein